MINLTQQLVAEGYIKMPEIIQAFYKIKRGDFLPSELADQEEVDAPLPIGHGVTNSQPLTVAFMLELLEPKPGQNILDIGSGSGWTTALLAEIVGSKGKISGVERISEIKEFGDRNIKKYNFSNVKIICGDGSKGLPNEAPFDRILVSAAAFEIPPELKNQLKIGGRLVIPTKAGDIRLIVRKKKNEFSEKIFSGFDFVPLIEQGE